MSGWNDPQIVQEMVTLPPQEEGALSPAVRERLVDRMAPLMRSLATMSNDPEMKLNSSIVKSLCPIIEQVIIKDIGDGSDCEITQTLDFNSTLAVLLGYMVGIHQDRVAQKMIIGALFESLQEAINTNPFIHGAVNTKVVRKRRRRWYWPFSKRA